MNDKVATRTYSLHAIYLRKGSAFTSVPRQSQTNELLPNNGEIPALQRFRRDKMCLWEKITHIFREGPIRAGRVALDRVALDRVALDVFLFVELRFKNKVPDWIRFPLAMRRILGS